jgi:hypothetical protein
MEDEVRRARLAVRHDLLPRLRTDDLPQLADDLLALHSSDPVTVYLSLLARMRHPSAVAVEQALYTDRSLIRHHAMRRTLWVATPPVVRLMNAAATGSLVGRERRRTVKLLAEGGITEPEAWLDSALDQVVDDLLEQGPSTARELGVRVPALRHPLRLAEGTPWAATQSAHTRVLLLLGFQGRILRAKPTGSWVNGAYRYAAADRWLPGGLGHLDPAEAAAELAHRWLLRFGPGLASDLQWWMGWTKAVTTRALAASGAVEIELDGRPGWLAPDDLGDPAPEPWVAVLPGLDPSTMGWKDRGWYLPASAADAFDRNGNAGPTIWVDGRVVGAWALTPAGEFRTHYFERVAAARRLEVQERVDVLAAAVGNTRFTIRFPGLIQARILDG